MNKLEQFDRLVYIKMIINSTEEPLNLSNVTNIVMNKFCKVHNINNSIVLEEVEWIIKAEMRKEIEEYILKCSDVFTKEMLYEIFYEKFSLKYGEVTIDSLDKIISNLLNELSLCNNVSCDNSVYFYIGEKEKVIK